jgi:protein ImuA
MVIPVKKADIVTELQRDILRLQGFRQLSNTAVDPRLGAMSSAFPNQTFPLGCVHEFLSSKTEHLAATAGFISGLLSSFVGSNGISLWISSSRTLFPPALKNFGLRPDRFIFIDLKKEKDVLWVMDEALKCGALSAVIGELKEISFTESRRLQLAVEKSQVTGFILRHNLRKLNTTACVSRWKISSLPSQPIDDLPGIGFPSWKVELLKMRNGKSGVWDMAWVNGKFQEIHQALGHPSGIESTEHFQQRAG